MPRILFAGFGGQGILFAGKVAANTGLINNQEVTWLPSYGPEMRGGTCNCSVCLSDQPIGSPMVGDPELFVAMNQPSYDKFIRNVRPNGVVVYDSTMVLHAVEREGVSQSAIPATEIAGAHGLNGLANIVALGHLLRVTGFTDKAAAEQAIPMCVPASKAHLVDKNLQALQLGYDFT